MKNVSVAANSDGSSRKPTMASLAQNQTGDRRVPEPCDVSGELHRVHVRRHGARVMVAVLILMDFYYSK